MASNLIPIGLPPPVIAKTEYTPPDQYQSLPDSKPMPEESSEPPAIINAEFDQIYSELLCSFKGDILAPEAGKKPAKKPRRHTDEKINTIRKTDLADKPSPTKYVPVSGGSATCGLPKRGARVRVKEGKMDDHDDACQESRSSLDPAHCAPVDQSGQRDRERDSPPLNVGGEALLGPVGQVDGRMAEGASGNTVPFETPLEDPLGQDVRVRKKKWTTMTMLARRVAPL